MMGRKLNAYRERGGSIEGSGRGGKLVNIKGEHAY